MSWDTMELSTAPHGDDCAQVGEEGYEELARAQCRALRGQLLRMAAAAGVSVPENCRLVTKGNGHDFGTYYEVAIRYDDADESAFDAAVWFENNLPERWDAEARVELGLPPPEPTDPNAPWPNEIAWAEKVAAAPETSTEARAVIFWLLSCIATMRRSA